MDKPLNSSGSHPNIPKRKANKKNHPKASLRYSSKGWSIEYMEGESPSKKTLKSQY